MEKCPWVSLPAKAHPYEKVSSQEEIPCKFCLYRWAKKLSTLSQIKLQEWDIDKHTHNRLANDPEKLIDLVEVRITRRDGYTFCTDPSQDRSPHSYLCRSFSNRSEYVNV